MRQLVPAAGLAAAVMAGLALSVPAQASVPAEAPAPVRTAVTEAAALKAAPVRNDGLNEPIYWVHGIRREKAHAFPCSAWNQAIGRYRALRATGPQHTVAYYKNDRGCNTRIGSFKDHKSPGIRELGRRLAWDIYNRYTRRNVSVDAVGHSMGGLIIRAAITGVQKHTKGFPPRIYVEDAVTLSTPHLGATLARGCRGSQCADMRPGSGFLKWLSSNPQSSQGTDWTLLGSGDDNWVDWHSAVSQLRNYQQKAGWMSAGHKVVFYSGQKLEHDAMMKVNTGAYHSRYWNFYQKRWIEQRRGASPVVVARNANWYWRLW